MKNKHKKSQYLQTGSIALLAAIMAYQNKRVRRFVAELELPATTPTLRTYPHVSIILPVRNEAAHIDTVLASLIAQDYPSFDITVIDDGSTDETPRLLEHWVKQDRRIQVHRIDTLPKDWAGKSHALHTGVEHTDGKWLLFTDADTRHEPQALRLAVQHAEQKQLDLLTMMTDMKFIGAGMHLLSTTGFLILTNVATPGEMRSTAHKHGFAVGQYMLVRRSSYQSLHGYAAASMRSSFADDVDLAEFFKQAGYTMDIVSGKDIVHNEQWTTWESAWKGWSKSLAAKVTFNPLAGLCGGLLLIASGALPLGILLRTLSGGIKKQPLATLLALFTIAAQINAFHMLDSLFDIPESQALRAPLAFITFGTMLLDTTSATLRGSDKIAWKGRIQSRPEQTSQGKQTKQLLNSVQTLLTAHLHM
ncbi:MAG TPA: glycosyltransferase family 2 protein [Dictyobacter sp.]|nr:glycosyltransferase family 2 protein [Dictyobacter sp.]